LLYFRASVLSPQVRRILGNPWILAAFTLLLAVVTLFPRISGPGLWEPEEMKVADKAVLRADRTVGKSADTAFQKVQKGGVKPARPAPPDCRKEAPDDTGARELTPNLAAIGVSAVGSSEGSMRLLFALLALICALATHGIAARLGTPRAGLFAAIVLLSFPLTVLQARQLTTEIGTATGAALLVYGLVAAARPLRGAMGAIDLAVATIATVAGLVLAFLGGGAFLGLLPPLAGVALAAGLGVGLLVAGGRIARQLEIRAIALVRPRYAIGRATPIGASARISTRDAAEAAVSLVAFFALIAVVVVLVHQIYDIQNMAPGTRQILGKSFVPRECWSEALGGIWRAHDDTRSAYDSMFEEAAFGMFPWSVLAPIALAGLALGIVGDTYRYGGRLLLAWAGVAWITATVFERKVGFTIYAGFPACAIAIGLWMDRLLAGAESDEGVGKGSSHGLLIGLWVFLGMLTLSKDVVSFTDKLTSLLIGGETIKYPETVKLLYIPLKRWILVLGVLIGLSFALGSWVLAIDVPSKSSWRYSIRRLARWGIIGSLIGTVLFGIFWAQAWQPRLSRSLSSKNVFSVYRDLHHDGERLGIMGDMGNSPRYYAEGPWEPIKSREELIPFLGAEERVFALAPASELCAIHRAFAGQPYYVLDDSNARFMLLSNYVDGGNDHNPLSTMVLRNKPDDIGTEFHATFDDRVELIGYTMPRRVSLRSKFKMTLYFHVKKAVSGAWKIFAHFDAKGLRFQGDHDPIRGRCATSFWQEGDYIVDTFEVEAGDLTFEPGNYQARFGFFTGTNPNWKNMKVTQAPPGAKDDADRVLIGTIEVD
jgi:hypothetical protein